MYALILFSLSTVHSVGIRGWLFLLLLLAVFLIIFGCGLAIFALYQRRQVTAPARDELTIA